MATEDSAQPVDAGDAAPLDELLNGSSGSADPAGMDGDPTASAGPSAMPSSSMPAAASLVEMPSLDQPPATDATHAIDMLGDVELDVKIELGRCQMLVEDVLRLSPGSVVELDKLAGDPVDVYVNEHLVARGEVLVVNDNFCVRINEIVSTES